MGPGRILPHPFFEEFPLLDAIWEPTLRRVFSIGKVPMKRCPYFPSGPFFFLRGKPLPLLPLPGTGSSAFFSISSFS